MSGFLFLYSVYDLNGLSVVHSSMFLKNQHEHAKQFLVDAFMRWHSRLSAEIQNHVGFNSRIAS